MKMKLALVSTGLLLILVTFFIVIVPTPPTFAQPVENHRYVVMGGNTTSSIQLGVFPPEFWTVPFAARKPYLTPMLMQQNITFSDPWKLAGYGFIVNLTVPYETYVGLERAWFDENSLSWYRMNVTLEEDGYGWIFLNATGDVDCYTFNNCTGVYWKSPSPKAGEKAASTGALPGVGSDGVAGTLDDGFGNGTADPRGSSILMLNSMMHVDYWDSVTARWKVLIAAPWPQVFTTGTTYDIVIEPASDLNGVNSTEEGEPWEFLAGLDHPGQQVPYVHPQWNAYVTYACAWSVLNYETTLGDLDVIFQIVEKKVRDDCVIADIDCNELVDIVDIIICALAFGSTPDDPNWDPRADVADPRRLVDIRDLVRIAIDFGERLTPNGIVRS